MSGSSLIIRRFAGRAAKKHCVAVAAMVACLFVSGNVAQALNHVLTVVLTPGPAVNNGALWRVDGDIWLRTGQSSNIADSIPHYLDFHYATNYYTPAQATVTNDASYTQNYLPFTNNLRVVIAGITTTNKVIWNISSSPGDFLYSSMYRTEYTNNVTITPIPVGDYEITFPTIAGYTAPASPLTTNISASSNNWLTGTYTRVTAQIDVIVNPTSGVWRFTSPGGFPADATNYTSFTLGNWHTNAATITNAPEGTYTIEYGTIPDYTKPANETRYVDAAGYTFIGTYESPTTVRVYGYIEPSGARLAGGQWTIAGSANPWKNHSEYIVMDSASGWQTIVAKTISGWSRPDPTNINIQGVNLYVTNTYTLWTNTIAVAVTPDNASWTITVCPTNFITFRSGTGDVAATACPTGIYTIVYSNMFGYTTPASQTTNIINDINGWFTGIYERVFGDIQVSVTPSFASWGFIQYPLDYTNYAGISTLSGSNSATLTNAALGLYTIRFNDLIGYNTPPDQTKTNNPLFTTYFTGNYSNGVRLTVHLVTLQDTTNTLQGIGSGTYAISGATGYYDVVSSNWYFTPTPPPIVTITAYPATNTAPIDNFFYKWARDIGEANRWVNPLTVTMDKDKTIWLYFSREFLPSDNVGDIDGDGLPDGWERQYLGEQASESAQGNNGRTGNQDNDWIPSTNRVTADTISFGVNHTVLYTRSDDQPQAYPLSPGALITGGYTRSNVKFNNFLECRGLDGFLGNNGWDGVTNIWVGNDDPGTDPTKLDTGDPTGGTSDGWKYYFWRWRSANAFNRGLTNSANLSWVNLTPLSDVTDDGDMDNDGLSDLEEYSFASGSTDPTHADTDGDGMDDYWESQQTGVCSPFDRSDGGDNPDDDYYAVSTVGILTNTLVGTLLTNTVCYIGSAASPGAAWLNIYTNTGTNVFDLYRDMVLKEGSLTHLQAGSVYTNAAYYWPMRATIPSFVQGYPVWIDMDGSGNYSAGDVALVNPAQKNDYFYLAAPASPFPGVTSYNPMTAWMKTGGVDAKDHPNTAKYINYEEYYGGDYLGRSSWDAGGRVISVNDDELFPDRNSPTGPNLKDTDLDTMADGWELYVGLDPSDAEDASLDPDDDKLLNYLEYANCLSTNETSTNAVWGATDPGVLVAPPPNDPHPKDTDWDGADDLAEVGAATNPTGYDTDTDFLPDGWELYAGSNPLAADRYDDPDGDGLENRMEFYTQMIHEWMFCDPSWRVTRRYPGGFFTSTNRPVNFDTHYAMTWDKRAEKFPHFMTPDFLTDPSFLYCNSVETNLNVLRASYPAAAAVGYCHSTQANDPDSDWDGMDDGWEFYHGLNPCLGSINLVGFDPDTGWYLGVRYEVGDDDADPDTPGLQVGFPGQPFSSLAEYMSEYKDDPLILADWHYIHMVGPFNFGLGLMDPDGDGLPNVDEYPYGTSFTNFSVTNTVIQMLTPGYHSDPTPLWMTHHHTSNSIYNQYINPGYHIMPVWFTGYLHFDENEGFDTDNDGCGDYEEINSAAGAQGNDPLESRNPIRNRALCLNGTNEFVRTIESWYLFGIWGGGFSVEAWIKPHNPTARVDQVIVEKAALFDNPYTIPTNIIRAHFRLGITNGLPYVLYNGKGAMTVYQATARNEHRITSNAWTHVAGTYNGEFLTVYVNGIASTTIRSTEIPAEGVSTLDALGLLLVANPQTIMVGARDLTAGYEVPWTDVIATNFFGGYIDEVRVWRTAISRGQILANKDRRFTLNNLTNSSVVNLYAYYTFDDVPDPALEGIVPANMALLDTSLSLHPTLDWWAGYAQHSTVYTGSAGQAYNYIVSAENHIGHLPRIPPLDDQIHFMTNTMTTNGAYNIPPGYRNTTDPYPYYTDLCFFKGAKAVAVPSWLTTVDPNNPDSTDADGDGLPDVWEIAHGLDPYDPNGDNGTWGDPDYDGLNNRAEYLAGLNPRSYDTDGDGISDYDSRSGPRSRTWGELYTDGDGMPDVWEVEHGLDPYHNDAHLDNDGDGWSNYTEYQAGTDPANPLSHPTPTISGTIKYNGSRTNYTLYVMAYQTNTMDGSAIMGSSGGAAAPTTFQVSGLHEGEVYLFAYYDVNGNGRFDRGEPAGLAQNIPVALGWANVSGVTLGLADDLPGYGRFSWTPATTGSNNYDVVINRISEAGGPTILAKTLTWPRNYFHEWDYQLAGIYGLRPGTYQWWVGSQNGLFTINRPDSLSKPYLIYPRGETLIYARNQMSWAMGSSATLYHLLIINKSNQLIHNGYHPAPYPDASGISCDYLPENANEWGNGIYYYWIAASNVLGESAWSDGQSFVVNLSLTNSRSISGDLYYFGKALATNIVVEAYNNAGFSGEPEARKTYALACTTNSYKGSFALHGLHPGIYYVRAFTDISPADGSGRNGRFDYWESFGFVKDSGNDYQPGALVLNDTFFISGRDVVIRDQDTDNDKLPDAWEMSYFGNLDQTGDTDYDGDGENNLEEYMLEGLDTDPTMWDTDGDGLSDHFERWYGGETYDPYNPRDNPRGRSLNPLVWDTDGDGYSDGAEIRRYHTHPLDPNSYPAYQPPCYGPCASPADYDADGRTDLSIYDIYSGYWFLGTWLGQFGYLQFGNAYTQPLLGDYDGDGRTDFAVYEPASGYWYIYNWLWQLRSLKFGDSETIPIPADYDGDFKTDFGVYYPAGGMWYIYTQTGIFTAFKFGNASTVPAPGDYDGDGRTEFAVYDPATGYWYIYTWRGQFWMLQFGNAAMTPVPGDFDGDGRTDFALYEQATGYWYVFTWTGRFCAIRFGWSDAIPVPGDYDGDGRTDLAVYYPAAGYWYIYTLAGKYYEGQFGWPAAFPPAKGR